MKKVVLSVLSLLFIFIIMLPHQSHAAISNTNIPLYLNQKQLIPEVSPLLVGNVTMVPIRIISEELGAKVTWNQKETKVTIKKGNSQIELWINKKDAVVNTKRYPLEEAPLLVSGNTLVPVRLVAENLGMQVKWNEAARSVFLTQSTSVTPPGPKPIQPPPVVPVDPNANRYPELRSIVVKGNQLQIQASGSISGKAFYIANPDRLVIDVPASAFSKTIPKPLPNTMGEIPTSGNSFISKIRYAYNDPATQTIRIVVELKAKAGFKVVDNGASGKLTVELSQAKYNVVLDAGHGSQDPGAKSAAGRKEKDFNLAMALKIQKLLQQNPSIQVTMTRATDIFIPLAGRVEIAEKAGADIFVSIHANSWMASSRGTETYYNRSDSTSLANVIQKKMVAATGFPDRGVRFGDFHVIRETSMPAVLLEVGYLSNATEDAAMADDGFRNRVAASVANGIKEYLKVN